MKLTGTRVLLTGASGGIGSASARALADAGARVMGVGRGPRPATSAATAWVSADLATAEGRAAVIEAARQWGAQVVVLGAGEPAFGPLMGLDEATLQRVLHMNLTVPALMAQGLVPVLRQAPQARLVFVGSALARIGVPGFAWYGATKAGVHRLAETLRRELADTSVRVQLLAPRATRTGFNSAAVTAQQQATATAVDPPERVAQALVRLLQGDRAELHLGGPERLFGALNAWFGPRMDGGFVKHRAALNAVATPPAGSTARTDGPVAPSRP